MRRYGQILVDDGFFASLDALETYAKDVSALGADLTRRDIAWRLDIGRELLVEEERMREIANWIALQVRR
jgi:GMP synthase (glutamine-hydrolysing)